MGGQRRTLSWSRGGLALAVAATSFGCAGSGDAVEIPRASVAPATAAPDVSSPSTAATTAAPVETEPPEPADTEPADTEPADTEAAPTTSPASTAPLPAEPPPPTPPPTVEDPFLRIGDEGDAVAAMQRKLVTLDYLQPGYTDALFDRATADALIDFQAQYGLVVDGIFGPETDRSLSAAAASVEPDG